VGSVEDYRVAPSRQEHLLATLRKCRCGQVRCPRPFHGLNRGPELSLPSVDQDKVGKRFSIADSPLKVATHDLLHHGVVVGLAVRCLADAEPPVFGAVSSSIPQPDGTADRFTPAERRNVEAQEISRWFCQIQGSLQAEGSGAHGAGGLAGAFDPRKTGKRSLVEQVLSVLLGKVDESALRSALRMNDPYGPSASPGQNLLEQGSIREIDRDQYLGREILLPEQEFPKCRIHYRFEVF
jgi:hypothetical protein